MKPVAKGTNHPYSRPHAMIRLKRWNDGFEQRTLRTTRSTSTIIAWVQKFQHGICVEGCWGAPKSLVSRAQGQSYNISFTISSTRILHTPGPRLQPRLASGGTKLQELQRRALRWLGLTSTQRTLLLIERRFLRKIYLDLGIDIIPFKLVCEYAEWIPWYDYFREWLYECYSKLPKEVIRETLPIYT